MKNDIIRKMERATDITDFVEAQIKKSIRKYTEEARKLSRSLVGMRIVQVLTWFQGFFLLKFRFSKIDSCSEAQKCHRSRGCQIFRFILQLPLSYLHL